MKKLIAMIGAVAMAFGLYAFPDTGMISGAGFDTSDGTESGYSWTTAGTLEEGVLNTAFWAGATDKAVVINGSPTAFDTVNQPTNYYDDVNRQYDGVLSIKTTLGTPVAQNVKSGGYAYDLTEGEKGELYFDAMIKPTVFDYTDDPAALIAAQTDAKIGVYAQMSEDESETNLFVYAKGATGATPWETTTAIDDSAWVRLTIKMIANIGTGKNPGYVVFVDGQRVCCADAIMDATGLTPAAQEWNQTGSLFEGLINSTEITDVAFDGQGLVDEIAFTTTVPSFAADAEFATIKWDVTKVAMITIGNEVVDPTTGSKVVKVADGAVSVVWTGKDKWMDGSTTVTPTKDGNFDVTKDLVEAVATFAGKKYAKLITEDDVEGAVTAANAAKVDGELVLLANAGAIEINNTNTVEEEPVVITLDLAGKTIQQPTFGSDEETVVPAITLTVGSLKIIDSDGNGIVAGNGVMDENNAIDAWEGALEIAGGTFNGVVGIGDDVLTISSETPKFAYAANKDEDDKCTFDYTMSEELKGKGLVANTDKTYWVVGNAAPSAGFVIQLVGNITTNWENGVCTFTCSNNMKMFANGVENTEFDNTFTPEAWYAEKQYVVVSEVLPAASAPAHKWYESVGASSSNKLEFAGNGEGGFSGKMDNGIIVTSGGTGNAWVGNFVTASEAVKIVKMADMPTEWQDLSIMRGAAVSKKLNVMLALSSNGMLVSFPLDADPIYSGDDQNTFQVPAYTDDTEATKAGKFEIAMFSGDAQYLYAFENRTSVSKFKVVNGLKGAGAKLIRVSQTSLNLGTGREARTGAIATIGGKEILYFAGVDESSTAKGIGVWAYDTATGTATQIVNDDTVFGTYGAVYVAGNSLNVISCTNTDIPGIRLMGWSLAADGFSVTGKLYEYNRDDLQLAGFGKVKAHCCDLFVSDNEEKVYIAWTYESTADDPLAVQKSIGWVVTSMFTGEYTEYAKFILNDENATDTSVTNTYRKGTVIAGAPAPATQENFVGWFTDAAKTQQAVFPLTLNADTELWAKYEAAGPYTPGTGGGSVNPTGTPGVYVVVGDYNSKTVNIVGGLKDTDTIIVADSETAKIIGVPANQIQIKLNGVTTAIDQKYFVGMTEDGFSLELSDAAKATLVTETEQQKPLVIGDNVDVTINTVAGLKYQLIRGTEVGEIETALGEPVVGDGKALKLTDNEKPEGKAFYVIKTSK